MLETEMTTMAGTGDRHTTEQIPVREFLVFRLGAEEYGIDLLKVQEIRNYEHLTRLANAPDYLKGVMNLRGIIVPVIDMRLRFQIGVANFDAFTVLIILNINQHIIGMVVDSVSDVVTLDSSAIKPPPEMGTVFAGDYLTGLGTLEQRMMILLDIEKLMSGPELGLIPPKAK